MFFLVVCGPGLKAGSWPKTDVRRRVRTGTRVGPGRACGPVFAFGMGLPWAHVPVFVFWGCAA